MTENNVLRLNINENGVTDADDLIRIDNSMDEFEETGFHISECGVPITLWGRPILAADRRRANKKHTKPAKVRRGVVTQPEEIDFEAAVNDLFVGHIQEWEGIGDKNGQPLKCSAEIRRNFTQGAYGTFAFAAVTALGNRMKDDLGREEEEAKN